MRSKDLLSTLILALIGILVLTGCGSSTITATPIVTTATPIVTTVLPTQVATTTLPSPTALPAIPSPVPSPAQPLVSDAEITARFDKLFDTLNNSGAFSGVVFVSHNGKMLYDKGFGNSKQKPFPPLTSASKFRIASDNKQFTAAAILRLQAQGKLNVKDSVCKYLQPCPKGWDQVTLHHLLTHTSGIQPIFTIDTSKPHTATELIAGMGNQPLKFEPGTQFLYGDDAYVVLAAIIEKLSGKAYEAFLRESFFDPLKMNNTGISIDNALLTGGFSTFDYSNLVGAGALYSTVEDLYRWTQALDAWERDPQSEYQPMFQPQVTSDIPGWKYGYALDVANQHGHLYVGHPGGTPGYGSLIARYPDDGLTIIELSNNDYVLDQEVMALLLFGVK